MIDCGLIGPKEKKKFLFQWGGFEFIQSVPLVPKGNEVNIPQLLGNSKGATHINCKTLLLDPRRVLFSF